MGLRANETFSCTAALIMRVVGVSLPCTGKWRWKAVYMRRQHHQGRLEKWLKQNMENI
jgi:hypothetical protein